MRWLVKGDYEEGRGAVMGRGGCLSTFAGSAAAAVSQESGARMHWGCAMRHGER